MRQGKKYEGKKETKDLSRGLVPWGGSCEGGKISTHSETPSWVGTGESFSISKGNAATGAWKAKQRIHHRDHAKLHFLARKWLTCSRLPKRVGAGYRGSVFGV